MFFDTVVRYMKPGTTAHSIKVCGSLLTGPTKINADVLTTLGFLKLKVSSMSDIMLGERTDVTIYNGNNFNGGSKTIKYTPTPKTFDQMTFNDRSKINDNIFSFVVNSLNANIATC